MDMSSFRNTIILFFAISYVHSAFALKCHRCTSYDNPDCKNNVNAKNFTYSCGSPPYSKNVAQNNIFFKADHPVSYASNVTWSCAKLVAHNTTLAVTVRDCVPTASSDICNEIKKQLEGLEVVVDHCSLCNSDLCNSSSSFSISYYSIGILVLVFTFMK